MRTKTVKRFIERRSSCYRGKQRLTFSVLLIQCDLWSCKAQPSKWWIYSNLLQLYHWFKIDLQLCLIEVSVDGVLLFIYLFLLLVSGCKYGTDKSPGKNYFIIFLSLHFLVAHDENSRWLQQWWQWFPVMSGLNLVSCVDVIYHYFGILKNGENNLIEYRYKSISISKVFVQMHCLSWAWGAYYFLLFLMCNRRIITET